MWDPRKPRCRQDFFGLCCVVNPRRYPSGTLGLRCCTKPHGSPEDQLRAPMENRFRCARAVGGGEVPALYKIFDEILVNAADNLQRDPQESERVGKPLKELKSQRAQS